METDAISPLQAARAETAQALERAAAAEAEIQASIRRSAEQAVESAVQRGVIPTRRTDLRDAWLDVCMKDARVIDLLSQIRGSPAHEARTAPQNGEEAAQ